MLIKQHKEQSKARGHRWEKDLPGEGIWHITEATGPDAHIPYHDLTHSLTQSNMSDISIEEEFQGPYRWNPNISQLSYSDNPPPYYLPTISKQLVCILDILVHFSCCYNKESQTG